MSVADDLKVLFESKESLGNQAWSTGNDWLQGCWLLGWSFGDLTFKAMYTMVLNILTHALSLRVLPWYGQHLDVQSHHVLCSKVFRCDLGTTMSSLSSDMEGESILRQITDS